MMQGSAKEYDTAMLVAQGCGMERQMSWSGCRCRARRRRRPVRSATVQETFGLVESRCSSQPCSRPPGG